MFDHEGPTVVNAIHELTSGVFEHLEITSPTDVDQRLVHMQCILRGFLLKEYNAVLIECKKLGNELAGDKWALGAL